MSTESPVDSAPAPSSPDATTGSAPTSESPAKKKKKHGRIYRFFRLCFVLLILCVVALAIARPFLPQVIRAYVNRVLDQTVAYQGKIGDVDLHLYRGAYSIHNVRIMKTTGNVPVPFFQCSRLDLHLQWKSLMYGRIVGEVQIDQPEVNFVDSPESGGGVSGGGGPWLKIVRDLFPFKINSVVIRDASVHFRTYQPRTPVDVYLSEINADISDLSNVHHSTTPLVTTINAEGKAMDQAEFQLQAKLDPTSYDPSFNLAMRLLNLDMTKINDLTRTYGGFDVKQGWFDLVVQANAREGTLDGSIKPLFRHMQIFDIVQDIENDKDPLQFFWQALVGGAAAVLTNQQRGQFGTLIEFNGTVSGPQIDLIGTIGNVLKNAFIRAYLPRLEQTQAVEDNDLHFAPPKLTDPISAGDGT